MLDILKYYILIINILSFLTMGIDKQRAIRNKWRIRERELFLLAIVGGSFGSIVGMQFFHHKTKHKKFVIGMPMILIIHLLIVVYCLFIG